MPFPPLLISVPGGIHLFGLIGLVLGPMVLAIFVSVFETLGTLREAGKDRGGGLIISRVSFRSGPATPAAVPTGSLANG